MERSGKNIGILFVVIFFTVVSLLSAAVPRLINYPGKLTDAAGGPLTGTYSIAFSFYDVEVGSSALWTETQSVSVNKGVFNVLLGSVTALNLDFSQQYWLEMKVGGETLTPRQRVSSVAYSIRSVYADYANQVSTPMVYMGHGDIDTNVSEKCYIHLDRVPASVKLFVIGEKLSTLFYTELIAHNHSPTASHTHSIDGHTHNINHAHTVQPHTHGCGATDLTHKHSLLTARLGGTELYLNCTDGGGKSLEWNDSRCQNTSLNHSHSIDYTTVNT